MIHVKRFFKDETGKILLSIILGLGLASLFKASCDSRSCIVYKAPDFGDEKNKKTLKYNGKCYKAEEKIETCDSGKKQIEV
jgi:hypothetical protein